MTNPTRQDPQDAIEFHMGAFKSLVDMTTAFEYGNMKDDLLKQVEAGMKQAREDAFNVMRDALRERGDDDRWTFVNYCLTGAMEHSGYGNWMLQVEYDEGLSDFDMEHLPGLPRDKERRPASATIIEQGDDHLDDPAVRKALEEGDEDHPAFKITHETIELGLQRIRQAIDMPDTGTGNWERNLTSVKGLHRRQRNSIIAADLRNDAGQLDVTDYLAILEVAVFNEVRYN